MRTDQPQFNSRTISTVEEWLELSRQPWFSLGNLPFAFLGPVGQENQRPDRPCSNTTEWSRYQRGHESANDER